MFSFCLIRAQRTVYENQKHTLLRSGMKEDWEYFDASIGFARNLVGNGEMCFDFKKQSSDKVLSSEEDVNMD